MTRVRRSARSARAARRGVTLVEMLVATAMCILGMWMLTWMFQQATASFISANQHATLTGQERMVTTIMTRDLEADRFPEDDTKFAATGRRHQKLSDYNGSTPPSGGYFLARSSTPNNTPASGNYDEAFDSNNFSSTRSGNHVLQFTYIRPDAPGNRVSVAATNPGTGPPSTAGTAVEVSYYLVFTGMSPGNPNVRLYDLMRVQRLVAHNSYDAADYLREVVNPWYTANDQVHEVMAATNSATAPTPQLRKMYTLKDLVPPNPLSPPAPLPPTGPTPPRFADAFTATARPQTSLRYGEDRLLSNVLSFEVKFTGPVREWGPPPTPALHAWPTTATTNPNPNEWPRRMDRETGVGPFAAGYGGPTPATYQGNSDYPYDFLPFDGVFDTGDPSGAATSATGQPTRLPSQTTQYIRITGVQIRVRALFGTTARQTTFVVAL